MNKDGIEKERRKRKDLTINPVLTYHVSISYLITSTYIIYHISYIILYFLILY